MAIPDPLCEFRDHWLPHVTDQGLCRLIDLLSSASPMLLQGRFSGTPATGCLASHIAWNHPFTCHLDDYAGVTWLTRVAGLNPATSAVILAWDQQGCQDWVLRESLLQLCLQEQARRLACEQATVPESTTPTTSDFALI
jgi:hypothetical protein